MGIPVISLRAKAAEPAPVWLFGVAFLVVELVLILSIMTAASYRHQSTLYSRMAAQEPMLNLLHSRSAKIVPLTGRPGASVRLIYDGAQKRGVLLVTNLANPGHDFGYRLSLVGANGSRSAWAFRAGSDLLTIVPIKAEFSRYRSVSIAVEYRDTVRSVPILTGSF